MIPLNLTTFELVATSPVPSFERLTADLRPAVKSLARQIAASETGFAVLAFLRCYHHTAITAGDLARQIDRPANDVGAAVADWAAAGLIEGETVGGIHFYRLTHDANRLRDLEEVFAWQEFWISQALSIAQAVGVPIMPLHSPGAAVLPAATAQYCHLGHAAATE